MKKRFKKKKNKQLLSIFGKKQHIFLIFHFCKYIQNLILPKGKIHQKKFFKNIEIFLGFKLDQNFRNFFKLKNISKENFDKYLDFISQPPYNCNRENLQYSEVEFQDAHKNSQHWQNNSLTNFQKEKLALCDAIMWIWTGYFAENKKPQ